MQLMRRIFERTARQPFHFGWKHGRYGDFWSLVHFLTGALLGLASSFMQIPFWTCVVVVAVIATLYEGLEVLSRVAEDVENVVMDIILVTCGAAGAYAIVSYYHVSYEMQAILICICLVAALMLIQYGWKNYLKSESRRKGSYKFVKLALYIVTVIGVNLAIASFFYGTSQSAY